MHLSQKYLCACAIVLVTVGVSTASAGNRERKAVIANLGGATPENATPEQLAAAVKAAIAANPRSKPGVIAGEALKFPSAITRNAGDEIATAALEAINATTTDATTRTGRVQLTADAARTAGTSRGANINEVPAFSRVALDSDPEAVEAATAARASKVGAGAILGGRASEQTSDADRIALANSALATRQLAGAATEIGRFIAAQTTDSDEFGLAISEANDKLASKIIIGVVAGDPDNAGEIVDKVTTSADATMVAFFAKASSVIAKNVGISADIEQVVLVGRALAGLANRTAANGKPLLAITRVASLTKILAAVIVLKGTNDAENAPLNKADEIAETAAFVVGAIAGNAGLNLKKAPKIIFAIIKGAVNGGKNKKIPIPQSYIADIAGSVALTIANSSIPADVQTAIRQFLLDPKGKRAKQIGGASNAPAVTSALTAGFDNSANANTQFEDGTKLQLAQVTDPETDIRPFNG